MLLSRLLHWKYSHVLTYCEHEFLISGVELCRSNWGICIIIIKVFSGCVCYQFCMLSSVCVCVCLCLCLYVCMSVCLCGFVRQSISHPPYPTQLNLCAPFILVCLLCLISITTPLSFQLWNYSPMFKYLSLSPLFVTSFESLTIGLSFDHLLLKYFLLPSCSEASPG